jgi:hypothetical protein
MVSFLLLVPNINSSKLFLTKNLNKYMLLKLNAKNFYIYIYIYIGWLKYVHIKSFVLHL